MKTLVIGASEKKERYSNKAIRKLLRYGHEVVPLALRTGAVNGLHFETGFPNLNDIHTVTLYIGPRHQKPYYDYIIGLQPARVVFNPGTENHEFEELLLRNEIEAINNCTLVMLDTGLF